MFFLNSYLNHIKLYNMINYIFLRKIYNNYLTNIFKPMFIIYSSNNEFIYYYSRHKSKNNNDTA